MLNRCLRCDSVFHRLAKEELCPQCDDEARRYARSVDDYLAHHANRDPITIAAATSVPLQFVVHYLKVQSPEGAAQAIAADAQRCARCGKAPATVGAHCNRCALAVRQDVHSLSQLAGTQAAGGGMQARPGAPRLGRPPRPRED